MRRQPDWAGAVERLATLRDECPERVAAAGTYAEVYLGARAAMVFDVVASHRRKYEPTVLNAVALFREAWPDLTLEELATDGPREGFGLPSVRWTTIIEVAQGLVRCRASEADGGELDDDQLVHRFATATEPVRFAPRLDPFVGSVSGIGIALFSYLRMQSGADALKPDSRVRNQLSALGFPSPAGEAALMLVAVAAAEDVGLRRLELDQLLW
jgi:hypothetical protein